MEIYLPINYTTSFPSKPALQRVYLIVALRNKRSLRACKSGSGKTFPFLINAWISKDKRSLKWENKGSKRGKGFSNFRFFGFGSHFLLSPNSYSLIVNLMHCIVFVKLCLRKLKQLISTLRFFLFEMFSLVINGLLNSPDISPINSPRIKLRLITYNYVITYLIS